MNSWTLRKLLDRALIIVCFFGTVGFAIGFTKWFDKWAYLPMFPNLLDSEFLVLSVTYLTWRLLKSESTNRGKEQTKQ